MCCGTEAGSYLRLIDYCITQIKDLLGPVTRVKKKKKKYLVATRDVGEGGSHQTSEVPYSRTVSRYI